MKDTRLSFFEFDVAVVLVDISFAVAVAVVADTGALCCITLSSRMLKAWTHVRSMGIST